jgi:hypothetical protein
MFRTADARSEIPLGHKIPSKKKKKILGIMNQFSLSCASYSLVSLPLLLRWYSPRLSQFGLSHLNAPIVTITSSSAAVPSVSVGFYNHRENECASKDIVREHGGCVVMIGASAHRVGAIRPRPWSLICKSHSPYNAGQNFLVQTWARLHLV